MAEKNAYDPGSPEWQLLQNYNSQNHLIESHSDDIKRATDRRDAAIKTKELYKEALIKLGHKFAN